MTEAADKNCFCPKCETEQPAEQRGKEIYCAVCGQSAGQAKILWWSTKEGKVALVVCALVLAAVGIGVGITAWSMHDKNMTRAKDFRDESIAMEKARQEGINEVAPAIIDLKKNAEKFKSEFEQWQTRNALKHSGLIYNKFLPDDNAIFRGLNFGMTKAQVMAHEASRNDTWLLPLEHPMMAVYFYYLGHENLGQIIFQFNETGKLDVIFIVSLGQPKSEEELAQVMNRMGATLSPALGVPRKHSVMTYEWFDTKMRAFLFAFPAEFSDLPAESSMSQWVVIYGSHDSLTSDISANMLREDYIWGEREGRAIFNEAEPE